MTISWEPFSDGQNTVALYRISVRDITNGESGPLVIDNQNLSASTTSCPVTVVKGHKYRAWVGAFTRDGGRIAQKELNFHSISESGSDSGSDPVIVLQQCSDAFNSIAYGPGKTIGSSGCGLVSVVNAYVYKSGNTAVADTLVTTLAAACVEKGQYTNDSLQTTIKDVFSEHLSISTKVTYSSSEVRDHVKNGGVAIVGSNFTKLYNNTSSSNHFVAIVSCRINEKNQYEYLLLDSALIRPNGNLRSPMHTNTEGWGWISSDTVGTIMNAANLVTFSDYIIKEEESTSRFETPVEGSAFYITRGWAFDNSANKPGRPYHCAIDYVTNCQEENSGVHAVATADGIVRAVGFNNANGNYVIIQHKLSTGDIVYSFYAHLFSYSVSEGQGVKCGDPIGIIGQTGSDGNGTSHLHFSICKNLVAAGSYVGYIPEIVGNIGTYSSQTSNVWYNPQYVIDNDRLPDQ